jgi:hypothetical protein
LPHREIGARRRVIEGRSRIKNLRKSVQDFSENSTGQRACNFLTGAPERRGDRGVFDSAAEVIEPCGPAMHSAVPQCINF